MGDGIAALAQVERDGAGVLPPAAAARRRRLQVVRGPLAYRLPRRQHRRHAWQGHCRDPQVRAPPGGEEEEVDQLRTILCASIPWWGTRGAAADAPPRRQGLFSQSPPKLGVDLSVMWCPGL